MYDLSGLAAGQGKRVRDDWTRLQAQDKLAQDAAYLHHEGKPVVAIWGIGFNDGRNYTLNECLELIEWLKSEGCTVMLGVPSYWREGNRDASNDPLLHEILKQADSESLVGGKALGLRNRPICKTHSPSDAISPRSQ